MTVAIDWPFLEISTTTGSFGFRGSHAQPETVEAVAQSTNPFREALIIGS
jgi:hypothetical protein